MRYIIEPVTYTNHPYLEGKYFRIYDSIKKQFKLGIYTSQEAAEVVKRTLNESLIVTDFGKTETCDSTKAS